MTVLRGDLVDRYIDLESSVRGMETRAERYYEDSYLGNNIPAVGITRGLRWTSYTSIVAKIVADRAILTGDLTPIGVPFSTYMGLLPLFAWPLHKYTTVINPGELLTVNTDGTIYTTVPSSSIVFTDLTWIPASTP